MRFVEEIPKGVKMDIEDMKQKLEILKYCLEKITDKECEVKYVREILQEIVPKDENHNKLVGTVVTEGKVEPAIYIPENNTIRISVSEFDKRTEDTAKVLCERFKYDDLKRVKEYYQLFSLLHEVEHAKQFLITKDKYHCSSNELKQGYKNVVSLLLGNKTIDNPIAKVKRTMSIYKYNNAKNDYIIERNANVEASSDIIKLAELNKEDEIKEIFELINMAMTFIGYAKDNYGCMYHTHDDLDLLRQYYLIKKDDIIDEDTRLRYGLEVNKDTRNKLLAKINTSNLVK